MVMGEEIREVRERLGLSQTQFGQLLGVHWVTVSRWEREDGLTPSSYHTEMILKFKEATKQEGIGKKVAKILVAAGAIAALLLILKAAFKREE